ncbi:MAG: helix-turn-helix domain-containing protein [Syntrophales bacterium]
MHAEKRMATVREIAALLRMKESTVCSLVSQGKLPGYKVGKSWRFDLEKVVRLFPGHWSGKERPAGNGHAEG